MPEYTVVTHWNTSKIEKITADSPEEAANHVDSPHICHQCSHEIEIADAYKTEVYEGGEDEPVYTEEL